MVRSFFWPPWRWHHGPKEYAWHLRANKQGNAKPRVNAIFYVPGRVGTRTKQGYYGRDPSRATMVRQVIPGTGSTCMKYKYYSWAMWYW